MAAPALLLSCGILRREVEFLIRKNAWPVEAVFLPSSLHFDFETLERELSAALQGRAGGRVLVLYGVCHPRMDEIVRAAGARRISRQNCIEMLLGRETFTAELARGAYFLLEEWARDWTRIVAKTFGTASVAREVFQGDRTCLLAVRTPCSGDFSGEAQRAAALVGLPLRRMDVALSDLESAIGELLRDGEEASDVR